MSGPPVHRHRQRVSRRAALLMAVAILACGLLCSWWTVRRADTWLRYDHLDRARMAAGAVDATRLASLAGSDADLSSPDYQRLKEQLLRTRTSYPGCRFLYVMGRRPDGAIFFYVDSESADSKDYSPPGQTYDEASPRLAGVFASGRAMVEGPSRTGGARG